ncbi:LuxR C-terminal-related transcriptional regulator [Amycolatopsis rhabdoformis]|uniref:LuxR C-terminal-related transcriptional regulator n=1 Tax=Amycolatopsis rhabdoformis TaxID=1448059 RepID=A0ABZ1ICC9_9PSEU|nr:LuxR C-terminal-related transcriptional regulator [Amycolatopsis rhabdoformis]WSE32131.1 LuxR C-terminal-related transcriptional regulator [Amycolatopsis rhabdoformis]
MADISGAERAVLSLCRRGLEVSELQQQVLAALRRVMTIDAAAIGTTDPETLLFTGVHNEDPLAAMSQRFIDNELGGRDVNTFTELMHAPGHVRSLDTATRGDWMASPRYREMMRPAGLGDELRATLVVDGHCWGYLCLHREDGELGFTTAETALIRRLAPHIAHALRQGTLLHPPTAQMPRRPGVVLLDEQLELVASTADADALLPLIGHGSTRLPLPAGVYSVAAALTTSDRPPSVRVRAATGGWLNLHASWLQSTSDTRIAVVLEPAQPQSTLALLLTASGLTVRELDVARLVLRGESTTAIAASLHISAHTVQDHLKSVFDKIGVHSRRDLVGRLLAGQAGSISTGAIPASASDCG